MISSSWLFPFIAAATAGCVLTTDLVGLASRDPASDASGDDPAVTSGTPDGGAKDGQADGAAAITCDPDRPFNPRVALGSVNTAAEEGGPRLSPDELTLYFESDRAGGPGASDLWVTTRASLTAPFAPATLLENQSSPDSEYTATPHPDGLSLAFASDRTGDFGIFLATRASPVGPFAAPSKITSLDTAATDAHPAFTPAGDALYFTSTRSGGTGGYDLYRADVRAGGFGPAVWIPELAGPTDEITPVLSADELTIIFARRTTTHDLWKARRASRTSPWQAPQRMDELSTDRDDFAGWMSPDGCRLYIYARTQRGDLDIFVADRAP